jgi:hypothetical protein
MKVTGSPGELSGSFAGDFLMYDWDGSGWAQIGSGCSSPSHSVTFTRVSTG